MICSIIVYPRFVVRRHSLRLMVLAVGLGGCGGVSDRGPSPPARAEAVRPALGHDADRGVEKGDTPKEGNTPKTDGTPTSTPVVDKKLLGEKAGQLWEANGLKMKFAWCPAGRFVMGSPKEEDGRQEDEEQVLV